MLTGGATLAIAAGGAALVLGAAALTLALRRRRDRVFLRRLIEDANRLRERGEDARLLRSAPGELGELADTLERQVASLRRELRGLEAQQREHRAILQSMTTGVIAVDPDHRVIRLNRAAAKLLRLDEAGARGRLLQEIVREPTLHELLARALGGETGSAEEIALPPDPPRRVQVSAEPLRGPRGGAEGALLLLNDVTHLRRLESMRSDFAANVSHELRTPITNIKGYVETLLDAGLEDRAQAERFLKVVASNASRLASIVDDVLALTRLEQPDATGSLPREPEPLAPILRRVAAEAKTEAASKSMRLEVDAPAELVAPVHAALLEQAVMNLVTNAIRYSPANTTVRLEAAARGEDRVLIAVVDRGPGIPPEHLGRIFERFYRIDRARSRSLGGTGLGLAIVKHIARVHGGEVEVDSVPGRGSCFRIVLPRSTEA